MKLLLVKGLNGSLKPAYDADYENMKKIKAGATVECEIKQPRNIKFHRKFFALINLVYTNQEIYNNPEHLRYDLIVESGHYIVRKNIHGEDIMEPKSISFASMDETEFNSLYNDVVDTICKYFHFGKEELIEEVAQYF